MAAYLIIESLVNRGLPRVTHNPPMRSEQERKIRFSCRSAKLNNAINPILSNLTLLGVSAVARKLPNLSRPDLQGVCIITRGLLRYAIWYYHRINPSIPQ